MRLVIVALSPALGRSPILSVAAFVIVDAPTNPYVGAWMRIARCVASAPVANCTVLLRLKLRSVLSVDAVSVVCAPPVTVSAVGDPVVTTG